VPGGKPQRLHVTTSEGVEEQELTFDHLSARNIQDIWGPGDYRILWVGFRDGKRRGTLGPSFRLHAAEEEEEEEDDPPARPAPYAVAPLPAITPAQSLGEVMQLMGVLQNMQQQQSNNTLAMVTSMVNAITGREQAQQAQGSIAQAVQQIAGALQAVAQGQQKLEERLAAIESGGAGGDAPGSVSIGGVPMNISPDATAGDVVKAQVASMAVQAAPAILSSLAGAASAWGERQMVEADKIRKERDAVEAKRAAPPPAPVPAPLAINGAASPDVAGAGVVEHVATVVP
jgi:hypothetical protein